MAHEDLKTCNIKIRNKLCEFIGEKIKEIPPHDFFSINHFSEVEPSDVQNEELIEYWSLLYFCKLLEIALGNINSRKELDIMLLSKIEFYENIAFMTTDSKIGLRAKEFYKKQLEAVHQFSFDC